MAGKESTEDGKSGIRNSKYILAGTLLYCLLYRLHYFGILHPNLIIYNSDSVDYFAPVDLFKGVVDLYRPPVYPCILNFFGYLSKPYFVRNLLFFQQTLSFVSVAAFYVASRRFLSNIWLVVLATVIYGCNEDMLVQNANINPESLCVSGSAFFLFLLASYLDKPASIKAFALGLFPLVLIMLKPTYLVLVGITSLFFVLRLILKSDKKMQVYAGLTGLLLSVSGVIGYCEMNKKCNGEFLLSKITLDNSIGNIVVSGAYKAGGDQELIARIDSTLPGDFYKAIYTLNNEHMDSYAKLIKRFPADLPPTADMLFSSGFPNTVNYSSERLGRFVTLSKSSPVYSSYLIYQVREMISQYLVFFLILIVEMLLLVFVFFKYRRIAWMHLFCILFVVGQAITIIVGGIGQWERVFLPAFPFIILLSASCIRMLLSIFKFKEMGNTLE